MTDLATQFAAAGVDGWLHAVDLDTGSELGHQPDELVVMASAFKIPVLVELFRQGAAGVLDLTTQVVVPAQGRTLSPFGLAVMRDECTLSLRDLAWLMMTISDNAATDIVCDHVSIESVNQAMADLGLHQTVLVGACRDLFATIFEDLGVPIETVDLTDPVALSRLRALVPSTTTRSTPRDVTSLLRMIWENQVPGAADQRQILGQQVWPHRLAAGFPEDDTRTSGKTGTLGTWRNECGVVEYADGGRYAVAVFTRSHTTTAKNPPADAVIGAAARTAVDELRA